MTKSRFLSFIACLSIVSLVSGAGCTQGPDAATVAASKRTDLNIWSVVDDEDVYDAIIKDYKTLHPFVNVNFRRLRLEEYESQLVNAMAEDRGPDVFIVHNDWVSKYLSKIQPMPAQVKVAEQIVVGTINKTTSYQLTTKNTVSLKTYKDNYPDTVVKDTVRIVNTAAAGATPKLEQRVVAIPVSVDTLGMYVNKDLLNAAGIATVPTTWDKFQTAVPRLVKQDAQGNLVQAATGLGTGSNVERASDIIAALMMQNGAVMSADDGSPTFNLLPAALQDQRPEPPAYQALSFYTDFANPAKDVYTWNAKQPNSLDAFTQGNTAFFFGYGFDLPIIRARAPKLNLGISPMPQIDGNPVVNFANYWAWTVSKKTKSPDIAWDFINFMNKPEEATKYLTAAKRPAALKSLLAGQLDDEDIGVFASQVLTSQSWYRGSDPTTMESALKTMADNVVNGVEDVPTAVNNAAAKVAQTVTPQ